MLHLKPIPQTEQNDPDSTAASSDPDMIANNSGDNKDDDQIVKNKLKAQDQVNLKAPGLEKPQMSQRSTADPRCNMSTQSQTQTQHLMQNNPMLLHKNSMLKKRSLEVAKRREESSDDEN